MPNCSPAALFAAFTIVACGDDPIAPPTDPRDIAYAAELDVDLDRMTRTASGLYYEDIGVGTGTEARLGTRATVLYAGWLPDGTLFDSRTSAANPFAFTIGIGQVIPGWDEGVNGMRAGGVRKLVIPPQLGYGNQAKGLIPGNSVLVYEIELLSVGSTLSPRHADGPAGPRHTIPALLR